MSSFITRVNYLAAARLTTTSCSLPCLLSQAAVASTSCQYCNIKGNLWKSGEQYHCQQLNENEDGDRTAPNSLHFHSHFGVS